MKERYDAYEVAVRNNILQVDEIRREEDNEPLGFNFIKLGLQDVLLNPETMEVYTPNTGQSKNLLTGEERAEDVELRQYIQLKNGRMNGSTGGGARGSKKLYSNGGTKPKKSDLTKSENSVKLDSNGVPFKYPTVQLPKKEYANVMDEIGRNWNSKYEGKEMCRLKFTNKTYFFENRGIGDYNIYHVEKR